MKKYFIYAAAAITLASCANDDFVGGNNTSNETAENAISFDSDTKALTRSVVDGSAAAGLLDNNFVVEGVKGDGTYASYGDANEVFDHYNVNWTDATANTTESNTSNWEYVAQSQNIKGTSSKLSEAASQTIKYWDYGTKQYDYVAVSLGKGTGATPTYADLSEIDYHKIGGEIKADGTNAVYTLTGTTDELAAAYIADLTTLYNRDGVADYKSTVTPNFRKLGTKVRIALYETVPGYAVGDVEFYTQAWVSAKPGETADGTSSTTPALFAASNVFTPATGDGVMSVYYPTTGFTKRPGGADENADYNQAHVVYKAASGTTMESSKTFPELVYTTAEASAKNADAALGTTTANATYAKKDNTDNGYVTVLPLGSSDNLQIRIKYTLYPIDGGSEKIVVDNACAVVPKQYCDWKPNYAYTYIFKISDTTNGSTGVDGNGNIVEGLTPITFDAVVTETEDGVQETITTVSTPSITTYQEGKVITTNNEYKAGDVYVSVMNGTTAVTLTDTPANYGVYVVTTGADKVTEALATDMLNGVKSNTGVEWSPAVYSAVNEIPTADGNTIATSAAKFTAESGKTYVFDYTDGTKNYVKIIRVQ